MCRRHGYGLRFLLWLGLWDFWFGVSSGGVLPGRSVVCRLLRWSRRGRLLYKNALVGRMTVSSGLVGGWGGDAANCVGWLCALSVGSLADTGSGLRAVSTGTLILWRSPRSSATSKVLLACEPLRVSRAWFRSLLVGKMPRSKLFLGSGFASPTANTGLVCSRVVSRSF